MNAKTVTVVLQPVLSLGFPPRVVAEPCPQRFLRHVTPIETVEAA